MSTKHFSTEDLDLADQFEAWREWFSPVFEISRLEPDAQAFRANNTIWDLGELVVSSVSAPSVRVVRGKRSIARAPADHWVISCGKYGGTAIETNGLNVQAPPVVPYVWSLGDISTSERSFTERVQVFLPRDNCPSIAAPLDACLGTTIDTELGLVLGRYMLSLAEWLKDVPASDLPLLGPSVRSMIMACIAPSALRSQPAQNAQHFRLERVRQLVHQNLRSPSLGADMISKSAGLSRSTLYRLFEPYGGIVHYIQRQRLLSAHEALADPDNPKLISTISHELCFTEAASFSRAFKHEFGCSPRDVREAALSGIATAPETTRRRQDISLYGDIFHRI